MWKRVSLEQNALDRKDFLCHLREAWANHANDALREAGHDIEIDHRNYKDRNVPLEPTIHEGYAARSMEARGICSARCEKNRTIQKENDKKLVLAILPDFIALDAGMTFLLHERRARLQGENSYQSEERARADAARDLRASLDHIGIPRGKQSYFCLACGREVEHQQQGGTPREIAANKSSVTGRYINQSCRKA